MTLIAEKEKQKLSPRLEKGNGVKGKTITLRATGKAHTGLGGGEGGGWPVSALHRLCGGPSESNKKGFWGGVWSLFVVPGLRFPCGIKSKGGGGLGDTFYLTKGKSQEEIKKELKRCEVTQAGSKKCCEYGKR